MDRTPSPPPPAPQVSMEAQPSTTYVFADPEMFMEMVRRFTSQTTPTNAATAADRGAIVSALASEVAQQPQPVVATAVEPGPSSLPLLLDNPGPCVLNMAPDPRSLETSSSESTIAVEVDMEEVVEVDMEEAVEVQMDQVEEVHIDQADEVHMDQYEEVQMDQVQEAHMDQADEVQMDQAEEVQMDQPEEVQMDQDEEVIEDTEEESSIKEGRFYLLPSPPPERNAGADEPELLNLFPLALSSSEGN